MKILSVRMIFKTLVLACVLEGSVLSVSPLFPSQAVAAEVAQDAPLVVLAKFLTQKNALLKRLEVLSKGTHPVTDPTLDLKSVEDHLEKAVSLAREALVQSDNEEFIAFKCAAAKAKVALARSVLSRIVSPILAGGNLSQNALDRIEDLGGLLDSLYKIFADPDGAD